MVIQVEWNGLRKTITSKDLFRLAAEGALGPKSRLWIDGKETTCDNVNGIVFKDGSTGGGDPRDSQSSANVAKLVRTPYLDYAIGGGGTPYVVVYLDAGRSVYSSAGGRVWLKGNIETQNNMKGGFWKSLGRMAAGESLFMSQYVANGPGEIAFATKLPGAIVAKELNAGESLICQRGAFLAASQGVQVEIFFQKRIGAGLFGGEGFIMQKVTGPGVVFLELDGSPYEYDLQPGERLTCDTGALAWMDSSCSIDVVVVSGLKNMIFGGEGLFDTVVTGPGKVTLQSMSITQTAGVLAPIVARLIPHN